MEDSEQFCFRNVVLHKDQPLGSGSYGTVFKAECDGLLSAAKIMHTTLFSVHDSRTAAYLQKFKEECRLLSLARHPNIVQYLGTYQDPETHLPVLLMELCDESLTKFLERSPGPLPYHTELSISHDTALALVYLHSNRLIHRDLTGNNILMIAGTRAKVTDFGMSKLAQVNPRMTSLTLCPGNVLYMSPEALDEHPTYTDKLDIFSFGVLLVQIMTRQFPNPSDRFQVIDDPRYPDKIRIPVPETERRHNHLQLIRDTHPLKPVALQCLKNKERERPLAQEVSVGLSELKAAPQYTESMQQAQTHSEGNGAAVDGLKRQDLQQQNTEQHTRQQKHHKRGEENMQQNLLNEGMSDQVKEPQATTQGKVNIEKSSASREGQNAMISRDPSSCDHRFKIVLIGDYGVGKTSIIWRYDTGTSYRNIRPSIGIDVCQKYIEVQGKQIHLMIWDTGGLEQYNSLPGAYYRGADGIVLVFDVTQKTTLEHIQSYWMEEIKHFLPHKVKMICAGNKCDLLEDTDVGSAVFKEEKTYSNIPLWETSAKTGLNIDMVFEVLVKAILDDCHPEVDLNPTVLLHSQLPRKGKCCMN